MSQLTYSEQIVQTAAELLHLERKATQALVRDRLRFVRLLKEGTATLVEAGKAVNFKKSWCYELWRRYQQKGIMALSSYPFKGRQPWLKPQQQAAFKQSLSDDSMATLAQAAERIKQQTGIDYTISGTWVALKRMGIKKKTGRPRHVHHDETAAAAFKKKRRP